MSRGGLERKRMEVLKSSNVTIAAEEGADIPKLTIYIKVSCCVLVFVLSAVGNVFTLTAFSVLARVDTADSHSHTRVVDLIISVLAADGFARVIAQGPFQVVSLISDRWLFGNTFCQVQAYLDALLRYLYLWYVSLLTLERYTKHLKPHEYLVTFTPLTVRVIIFGIFVVVVAQVTGPIYGWGKYDYVEDFGICGIVRTPNFGCSYIVYIVSSVSIPPVTLMTVCWASLSLRRPVSPEDLGKRDMSPSRSRLLDSDKEVLTILLFVFLSLMMTIPRHVMDVLLGCNFLGNMHSPYVFAFCCLESANSALLPGLCISMHRKVRLTLRMLFRRQTIIREDQELTLRKPLQL